MLPRDTTQGVRTTQPLAFAENDDTARLYNDTRTRVWVRATGTNKLDSSEVGAPQVNDAGLLYDFPRLKRIVSQRTYCRCRANKYKRQKCTYHDEFRKVSHALILAQADLFCTYFSIRSLSYYWLIWGGLPVCGTDLESGGKREN